MLVIFMVTDGESALPWPTVARVVLGVRPRGVPAHAAFCYRRFKPNMEQRRR